MRNAQHYFQCALAASHALENMTMQQLRKESHPIQRTLENVSDEMRFGRNRLQNCNQLDSQRRDRNKHGKQNSVSKTVVQWGRHNVRDQSRNTPRQVHLNSAVEPICHRKIPIVLG